MRCLKCRTFAIVMILSIFFVSGARSQEPFRFQYTAKVVCGAQRNPEVGSAVPQVYATTINVHNPEPQKTVSLFKKLALTVPPGNQKQGAIISMGKDELGGDGALATDCADLRNRARPGAVLPPFFEGFVVIQSLASLDVVGVYTVPGGIDVVQIQERRAGP